MARAISTPAPSNKRRPWLSCPVRARSGRPEASSPWRGWVQRLATADSRPKNATRRRPAGLAFGLQLTYVWCRRLLVVRPALLARDRAPDLPPEITRAVDLQRNNAWQYSFVTRNANDYRNREMVQPHQGLRLHPAGRRLEGRVRAHLGRRALGHRESEGRPEGQL